MLVISNFSISQVNSNSANQEKLTKRVVAPCPDKVQIKQRGTFLCKSNATTVYNNYNSFVSLGNSMDGMCKVGHISGGHTCHRNTSILCHVDGVLVNETLHLRKEESMHHYDVGMNY